MIRGVTGITSASVDAQAKTITIQGNASQVAMAEWIAGELESPPHRASPELRISADDLLRIFYLSPARTVLEQQEIATIIRAIGEIQTSFTCAYPRNALNLSWNAHTDPVRGSIVR